MGEPNLSRRNFLKAATGAVVVAGTPQIAQASDPTTVHQSNYPNLTDALTRIAPHVDVVGYADDQHADSELTAPVADRGLLQALKKEGFTNIELECPKDVGIEAKKYMAGKITRQEFIDSWKTKYADALKANKVPREPDDLDGVEPAARNILNKIDAAKEIGGYEIDFPDRQTTKEMVDVLERERKGNFTPEENMNFLDQTRFVHDPDVAKEINDRRKGGKTLFVYGSGHLLLESEMNLKRSFDKMGVKTALILPNIHADHDMALHGLKTPKQFGGRKIITPDILYTIPGDRVDQPTQRFPSIKTAAPSRKAPPTGRTIAPGNGG